MVEYTNIVRHVCVCDANKPAAMCVPICMQQMWDGVEVVTTIRLNEFSGINPCFDLPSTAEGRRKRCSRSRGDAPEMNTLVKPAAV